MAESSQTDERARSLGEYIERVAERGRVRAGEPLPLGAHSHGDGVNFALFSRHATAVWLELFRNADDAEPAERFVLRGPHHRTGDIWHIWIQGIKPGQLYAYRVDGPHDPEHGFRFNPTKLLLDPYATSIAAVGHWDFAAARDSGSESASDDAAAMPKCVHSPSHFHWNGDLSPATSWGNTVIYETHVRGLTIHPSSGVVHPGTYRGLVERLRYLQDLGVTAIELMPVHEFNEDEIGRTNPLDGEPLRNYWGYSTVAFMAPKASYSSGGSLGQQALEFREMVRACHKAGMEVFLDVVFTHTAEGNELGPTLHMRGLDNPIYYALQDDPRFYRDYTGTGNSINAHHPVVRDLVLDSLRYWVIEMHVDGFRFDLASVLGRDEFGQLPKDTPLLERIAEDPVLRKAKLIAEAWDAAGAYQVGSFSERRWAEWNGHFRDDVRRFWRGDEGMVGSIASRICGSSDIYLGSGKGPESSINFVTCHDGFTLADLVSYSHKHNEANGEGNRDGIDENFSANYGTEGPTNDPEITAIRQRQIKNLLLTLMISRGVPMLLGGDEFCRTQHGNNNAYCQDNETSWYDWGLLDEHADIHRFTKRMIAFRSQHPVLQKEEFYSDSDIIWLDATGSRPDWASSQLRHLGCQIRAEEGPDLLLMFNAGADAVEFGLPSLPSSQGWHIAADTARLSPDDITEPGHEPKVESATYQLAGRSSVILIAK